MPRARGPVAAARRTLLLAAVLLAGACGGGGGGGGDSSTGGGDPSDTFNPKKDFFLSAGFYARPIFDPTSGELSSVVNPASLYETDPITGVPVPGFPKPLVAGAKLENLVSFNFEQILDPLTPQIPLVPRNAAVVLEFSKPVDPASLLLSDLDPDNPGLITAASAIQVRHKDGTLVPARATVDGQRVVIYPFIDAAVGWEASPLLFDTFGNPVEDSTGWLRIFTDMGAGKLASTSGLVLVDRPDKLSTAAQPLPFNPGNAQLDAIVLQTENGAITFNGFLPDLTAPRIIRPVQAAGTVLSTGFSGSGQIEITGAALPAPSNVIANGGLGEWANALLSVTGAGGVTSEYVVEHNENDALDPKQPVFVLAPGSVLDPSVAPGASWVVLRSEFYEPVPPPLPTNPVELANVTVDPENHPRDASDPQDLLNHDLRYFLRIFDENDAEVLSSWNPAIGKFQPVPPKVSLRLRFSEPMDAASFRPFETFYVTDTGLSATATAFNRQRIGTVSASIDGREITFSPILLNQLDPSGNEFIGFGGTSSTLKLVLRSIPEEADIAAVLDSVSASQLDKLVDLDETGVDGVTDLGGRGLGLPHALLDQGDSGNFFLQPTSPGLGAFPPAIDFSVSFQTQATADDDWGAVVHRFMGQPFTSIFTYPSGPTDPPHDTISTGVEYYDYPPADEDGDGEIDRHFIYGPSLLDVGLNIPGHLTGAPASVIEHLIDNFNKPKASPWASPTGEEDVLAKLGFGVRTPLNSAFGARFQHVYRAGDASPSYNDYVGVVLDLVGLAWAPDGNTVATSTLEDIEILVGLSNAKSGNGPTTNQNNGIPDDANSGLKEQFDCNLLEWTKACCKPLDNVLDPFVADEPPLTTVVNPGTTYVMSKGKLINPANSAGLPASQFNTYLDYPTFNAGIDPVFGKTNIFSFPYDSRFPMLIEYRIKPQENPPSNANFYRFSPGILSSVLPRFRVFSQGQNPYANCVAPCNAACTVAGTICRGGEGGPLLEPGTFTQTVVAPNANGINGPNGEQSIVPPPQGYILPPASGLPNCSSLQPVPDWQGPGHPNYPCNQSGPRCNTLPEMNWYFANGMLQEPLPSVGCFPGANGAPATDFYGYGPSDGPSGGPNCPPGTPGWPVNEPNYLIGPADYGDNSRYHMLWKYKKRVSAIQSPTVQVDAAAVEYHVPFIDPPVASVSAAAGLRMEFRASSEIDFSVPALDSGYVDQADSNFMSSLTGVDFNRVYIKFRATFAVAPGQQQPPSVDLVIIPYRKLSP